MSYRIGSFNLCKASLISEKNEKKEFKKIASIIKDNFDIIAIQEILSEFTLKYLIQQLGSNWDGCWAQPNRSMLSPQAAEGYAFIWNKTRFGLPKQRIKNSTKMETAVPVIVGTGYHGLNGQRLLRDPYYGRFIPVNGPFFELRLINTHIRFGESAHGSNELAQDNEQGLNLDSGEYALRRNELKILTTQICETYGATHKNGRAVYTFLLGDYNLEIKNDKNTGPFLLKRIEVLGSKRCYITVQEEKTTLRQSQYMTDGMTGEEKYSHNYDHFTYDEDLVKRRGLHLSTPPARRIDTLTQACHGDVALHRREISDHVPICMDIDFRSR